MSVSHNFYSTACFLCVHFLLLVSWVFLQIFFSTSFFFYTRISFYHNCKLACYIFLMPVMFFTVNCFFLTCKHFLSYCLFYFYLVYTYLDTYAYTLIPVPVFTYIPFTMVHVINLMRTTIYSPHIYTCTFLPVNICLPM